MGRVVRGTGSLNTGPRVCKIARDCGTILSSSFRSGFACGCSSKGCSCVCGMRSLTGLSKGGCRSGEGRVAGFGGGGPS